MMTDGNRNIVASVHQRLLNKARETDRPFNDLLQHFSIERFIYRLDRSHHMTKFILTDASESFEDVAGTVKSFLEPLVVTLAD